MQTEKIEIIKCEGQDLFDAGTDCIRKAEVSCVVRKAQGDTFSYLLCRGHYDSYVEALEIDQENADEKAAAHNEASRVGYISRYVVLS